MSDRPIVKPAFFIIYGFRGDLTKRKILPGLLKLEEHGMLPDNFQVFGTSRQEIDRDEIWEVLKDCSDGACPDSVIKRFQNRVHMAQLDLTKQGDFEHLRNKLDSFEQEHGLCFDMIHYLAIPPKLFAETIRNIGQGKLNTGCSEEAQVKILIEKPFGNDLASAQELQSALHECVHEENIYLVDHYLAKEPVENILYFIRNNPMLADIWNSKYIRRMEIMAVEKVGAEMRADYYDDIGALRDMFQSHLLEVLALLTLEQPYELNNESVREARLKLLSSVKSFDPNNSVRGQYKGYREEINNPESTTETFATTITEIDTPQWKGTSFVLTSGKKFKQKQTVAKVYFASDYGKIPTPNILTFEFYPGHGVSLGMNMKQPGSDRLHYAELNYKFPESDQGLEGYQTIILAALTGDRSVFTSTEEAIVNWQTVQPLLDAWSDSAEDLVEYEPGKELT